MRPCEDEVSEHVQTCAVSPGASAPRQANVKITTGKTRKEEGKIRFGKVRKEKKKKKWCSAVREEQMAKEKNFKV